MKRMNLLCAAVITAAGPVAMLVQAKPEFATKEKKACVYCHLTPVGGLRGFRGIYYARNKYSFAGFVEAVEAKKAGVPANAMGKNSKPRKPYSDE